PDDPGRQVGGESRERGALVRRTEEIGVVGDEVAKLRARVEDDPKRGASAIGRYRDQRAGRSRRTLINPTEGASHAHKVIVACAVGDGTNRIPSRTAEIGQRQ